MTPDTPSSEDWEKILKRCERIRTKIVDINTDELTFPFVDEVSSSLNNEINQAKPDIEENPDSSLAIAKAQSSTILPSSLWDKLKNIDKTNDIQKPQNRIKITTGQELLSRDPVKIEWIVRDLIPIGGVTILGSEPGCFKTFIGLHISDCVCHGKDVFNAFPIKIGKVLFLDEENGENVMHTRLLQITTDINLMENIGFSFYNDVKLDNTWRDELEEIIIKCKPDLIVVDSMVRFLNGNENDAEDVKMVFDIIKYFKKKYESSWLILHHIRKSGGKYITQDDLRGSGDFGAFADVICMISKKKNTRNQVRISQSKNRHQQAINDFAVNIIDKDNGTLTFEFEKLSYEKITNVSANENCAECLKKGFISNNIKEFKTGDYESSDLYTRSAYHSTLKLLKQQGIIKKEAHGKYIVNEEGLKKESENLKFNPSK